MMKKASKRGYNLYRNILIEEYKAIYFHIPKNGCTSFKKHFFRDVGDEDYKGPIHRYDFPFATSRQLKSDYIGYLKFTFVRNPWSRLVSCYKSKIRSSDYTNDFFNKGIHLGFNRYKGLFYGDMPFKEFAEAVCTIPNSIADSHFISQLFWLTDNTGELRPNYIGKLEDIESAYDDIFNKTGLSFAEMKACNRSSYDASYTSFYDEELKEKVRQRYAGDVEIFEYDFDSGHNIKQLGVVDNALHNKLAQSSFVIPILKERCERLIVKLEIETDADIKSILHKTLIETRRSLRGLQNESNPLGSRLSNFLGLNKLFSKK